MLSLEAYISIQKAVLNGLLNHSGMAVPSGFVLADVY